MVSIKDKRVSSIRTICEVHREIYDIIMDDKNIDSKLANELIELLEEAYQMAKKMNHKLRQYKYNYDDEWWEKTRDEIIKEKLKRRGKK